MSRVSRFVDQYGRPLALEPAYKNAGGGYRFDGLHAPFIGPNAALLASQPILVARSRERLRNDAILWKGLSARVANTVGTGIRVESLASTGNPDTDASLREEIGELIDDWAEEADADGVTNFYGLQAIMVREMFAAGECFARLRPRRRDDGIPASLQVQLISGDQVPVWKTETLSNGHVIRAGIEFDGIGKRVAYWMYRHRPNDGDPRDVSELVRVPAEEVIHVFEREAPGQIRGIPMLCRVLLRAHEMGLCNEATLTRMATASMFAVFFTAELGEDWSADRNTAQPERQGDIKLAPGMGVELEPGRDVKTAQPPDIGASYREFWKAVHLELAAGVGVPYEMLTGDLSDVNYSSIRAGIVEFRRATLALIENTLVPSFRKIYRAVLTSAIRTGEISYDVAAFLRRQRQILRAEWTPQGFDWVDPLKEVLAWREMIAIGLDSRSAAHRELGYNPRRKLREIADERHEAAALGLRFETDPEPVADESPDDASRRRQNRDAARASLLAMAQWDDRRAA